MKALQWQLIDFIAPAIIFSKALQSSFILLCLFENGRCALIFSYAFILTAMLLRPEVNSVLATEEYMKALQWQLIDFIGRAIISSRRDKQVY